MPTGIPIGLLVAAVVTATCVVKRNQRKFVQAQERKQALLSEFDKATAEARAVEGRISNLFMKLQEKGVAISSDHRNGFFNQQSHLESIINAAAILRQEDLKSRAKLAEQIRDLERLVNQVIGITCWFNRTKDRLG